ncbi:MAG: SUMF1/EgtB/PvdO family nonheme iron enzyme [Planctomycetota bacterium]
MVIFQWLYIALMIPLQNASSGYLRDSCGSLLPLPEMRLIRGGEFMMGTEAKPSDVDYHEDERPRLVKVDTFYLGRFPVTTEQFCLFLNDHVGTRCSDYGAFRNIEFVEGRYRPKKDHDRCPVNGVNWIGAADFCTWMSNSTGLPFRLPTEAEWEFAVRGVELRSWPWGNEAPPTGLERKSDAYRSMIFFNLRGYRYYHPGELPPEESSCCGFAPVGSFPRGQTPDGVYGLMDRSMGEWCSDPYYVNLDDDHFVEGDGDFGPTYVIRGFPERFKNLENWRKEQGGMWRPPWGASNKHSSRSWTRVGGNEQRTTATFRLAMDFEPPK